MALLARLRFRPEELELFTSQLSKIVGYVEQLGELDTEDVEPMSHALELRNVFRGDEPGESLDRKAALANAPKHDDEFYLVPPPIE